MGKYYTERKFCMKSSTPETLNSYYARSAKSNFLTGHTILHNFFIFRELLYNFFKNLGHLCIILSFLEMDLCLFGFLISSSATRLYRGRVPRQAPDNFTCCNTRDKTERPCLFCLRRSHYTETDPISGDRVATAAIETGTSLSGVAHSTY